MPMGSKAFEVLVCLVEHAGEVVSKEQLLIEVWPNSFVEESNLSQQVFSLRKALGDRSDLIVTIPGRGYQFTGPVAEANGDEELGIAGLTMDSALQEGDEVLIQTVRERSRTVS